MNILGTWPTGSAWLISAPPGVLLVEMGPLLCLKKSISREPHMRMRSSNKIYWGGNRRQPPGSQCPIFISRTVKEDQPCLHKVQYKSKCPKVLCYAKAVSSLVHVSPHPDRILCSWLHSGWCFIAIARLVLGAWGPRQMLGLHGCNGNRTCEQTG